MPIARVVLWTTALLGLTLFFYTVFGSPPSVRNALLFLLLYGTCITAGVLNPHWQMFTPVLTRVSTTKPELTLTFDDGPDPASTPEVLRLLAVAGQHATFFVIGRKAEQHPDLIRAIQNGGHSLGLHGYAHDHLFSLRSVRYARNDIQKTQRILEKITGLRPPLFRPPLGFISPGTARAAIQCGTQLITWSSRGFDGVSWADPQRVFARILPGLQPGAIVLLHDALERGGSPPGLAALPQILETLKTRGLRSVPLAQLIDQTPTLPEFHRRN